MKKTLIALAALAATGAFAQNVTLTGTFDATYRYSNTTTQGGTKVSTSKLSKDGIGTSNFTLAGNEDLGGGLKAEFLLETDFNPADTTEGSGTTGYQFYVTGQNFVGLSGAFGSLKLGAPNAPTLAAQGARAGSFGTKDGGRAALSANSYSTMMGLAVTRFDSSFLYTSPNVAGFQVQALYAPRSDYSSSEVTGAAAGAIMDLGLSFSKGPIAAGVTKFSRENGVGDTNSTNASTTTVLPAVTAKIDLTTIYASYDFTVAKLIVGAHTYGTQAGTSSSVDQSGMNIGVEVPLSPALTLSAQYQKIDDKTTTDIDATQAAIGAQYALSKRTTVYARYIKQTADNVTTSTVVNDANRMLMGLRHNF